MIASHTVLEARKRKGHVSGTPTPKNWQATLQKPFHPWRVNSEDIFEIDFHRHDGNINWESLDSIVTENQKAMLTLDSISKGLC